MAAAAEVCFEVRIAKKRQTLNTTIFGWLHVKHIFPFSFALEVAINHKNNSELTH